MLEGTSSTVGLLVRGGLTPTLTPTQTTGWVPVPVWPREREGWGELSHGDNCRQRRWQGRVAAAARSAPSSPPALGGTRPQLHPPHRTCTHGCYTERATAAGVWLAVPCTALVPARRRDRTPGLSGSGPSHRGYPPSWDGDPDVLPPRTLPSTQSSQSAH